MKSLFIGGVADGRWMEHREEQSVIDVPCYPTQPVCIDYLESNYEFVDLRRDQYRRQSLLAHRARFDFFALASLSYDDVMRKLIENYRPVTETGRGESLATGL